MEADKDSYRILTRNWVVAIQGPSLPEEGGWAFFFLSSSLFPPREREGGKGGGTGSDSSGSYSTEGKTLRHINRDSRGGLYFYARGEIL